MCIFAANFAKTIHIRERVMDLIARIQGYCDATWMRVAGDNAPPNTGVSNTESISYNSEELKRGRLQANEYGVRIA
jgi:hypothetical protein